MLAMRALRNGRCKGGGGSTFKQLATGMVTEKCQSIVYNRDKINVVATAPPKRCNGNCRPADARKCLNVI